MKQVRERKRNEMIMKTLWAAKLIDGFWDRWIAHGVEERELAEIRSSLSTKEQWDQAWKELGDRRFTKAKSLIHQESFQKAEVELRTAGLYYQLIQWLVPGQHEKKKKWLNVAVNMFHRADQISPIETIYQTLDIGDGTCAGRVRVPLKPKGAVIMINPFDSTKEELFTYETDFLNHGYAVVNFDGPGQGETFSNHELMATTNRWRKYVDRLIEYAATVFPQLEIYLFGTSSGAAWTLYGSGLPPVSKAVAISPAFVDDGIQLPDYFIERTECLIASGKTMLPDLDKITYRNPVLLVHGKKDVMVSDQNIDALYRQLPAGKRYMEYENEGHCCNYKLAEIRERSMKWFQT